MNTIIVMLLKFHNRKIVLHLHNKGASKYKSPIRKWMYRRMFYGTKVILLSELLYDDISEYVKREDVLICPNGIPPTLDYEPTVVRNNKIPKLLFLSNLIESKGVLVLLDALRILKDKGLEFLCDFVGAESVDINAERFVKEVSVRNLSDRVKYHGKKYGKEKKSFFENADIFVFPTFFPGETFGLVNLEAMEYKLPIVTTNVGGIPDVVIDGVNGLICKPEDPVSLFQCIEKLLLDNIQRIKMGEAGYKRFIAKYMLPVFEKRMCECLFEVAKVKK